jgi:Flp pilus assembly protein TadG
MRRMSVRRAVTRVLDSVHHRLQEERGAVAVIVAVAMVPLLGFVAIAVDVGALYSEKAQLQNGADAAALAIAQACGSSGCMTAATRSAAQSGVATLVNANANDGTATLATPTFPTANSVTVTVAARDGTAAPGRLALVFAPVLGIDTAAVSATATVAWGSPSYGPSVLPLAFAPCVFALHGTDGTVQLIRTHGSDDLSASCTSTSPSGQALPGGFGWLADPTNTCKADVASSLLAPMQSDTGNSLPANCETVLMRNAGKTVILPVYSDKSGSGSGGRYTVKGWAAFELLGWRFPSSSYNNNNNAYPSNTSCTGNCTGLIGRFVKFVTLDDSLVLGGADLGTSVVTLTQ